MSFLGESSKKIPNEALRTREEIPGSIFGGSLEDITEGISAEISKAFLEPFESFLVSSLKKFLNQSSKMKFPNVTLEYS